jgi:F0F1-type ATP synthase assembly protein I
LLGLGWQIATTLLIFTGGGYALDRWLGTLPWFLLIGAALGMVGVFIQIFRIAAELDRQEKERKANLNS